MTRTQTSTAATLPPLPPPPPPPLATLHHCTHGAATLPSTTACTSATQNRFFVSAGMCVPAKPSPPVHATTGPISPPDSWLLCRRCRGHLGAHVPATPAKSNPFFSSPRWCRSQQCLPVARRVCATAKNERCKCRAHLSCYAAAFPLATLRVVLGSHERSRKEMRRCATVKENISFGPTTIILGACREAARRFVVPGTREQGREGRESSIACPQDT